MIRALLDSWLDRHPFVGDSARRYAQRARIRVELVPAAAAARIRTHADGLAGNLVRLAFGPLVGRPAPTCVASWGDGAVQPVDVMELR